VSPREQLDVMALALDAVADLLPGADVYTCMTHDDRPRIHVRQLDALIAGLPRAPVRPLLVDVHLHRELDAHGVTWHDCRRLSDDEATRMRHEMRAALARGGVA